MNILVLGGTGRIGGAIAYDLAKNEKVDRVGISGNDNERLQRTIERLKSEKVFPHKIDLEDETASVELITQYDVAIVALPNRRLSYKALEYGIKSKVSLVDILEEYHRKPEAHEIEGMDIPKSMTLEEYGEDLHVRAKKAGITFLDGMGFAPGLSNITTQNGIDKLDRVTSAVARVGGIPSKETSQRHPLKYLITWSFEHVLREYMVALNIRKNGKITQVMALDDHEEFQFTRLGRNETLECFITPGMPSYLYTHPELDYFTEKTIRWPGHWQGIQTLKECGLLDIEPVDFGGTEISPRQFMLNQLEPKLRPQPGDADSCVMYNTVIGEKEGKSKKVEIFMWDEEDKVNSITSMARVTGFSAAIAGVMVAEKTINKKGIVAPEEAIRGEIYEAFIAELAKRSIKIDTVIS